MAEPLHSPPPSNNALHIGATIVVTLAVIGFFAGLHLPDPVQPNAAAPAVAPQEGILPAKAYAEMRKERRTIYTTASDLEKRLGDVDMRPGPVQVDTTLKDQALTLRASRRAYDGAPPTIPHPVTQRGDLACVTCHSTGFTLEGVAVPRMSHKFLEQCTQCHVSMKGPFPPSLQATLPDFTAPNSFVGLNSPSKGERAWPGSPPTIPHRTWMRSQCLSCHAPHGRAGMQTSHPNRQSCTQCHGVSSKLDQHVLSGVPSVFAPISAPRSTE